MTLKEKFLMTVQDFVKKYKISRRTVYRWIESGKIHATKIDDKWDIADDVDIDIHYDIDDGDNNSDNNTYEYKDQLIEQLRSENEYLRSKLDQAQEDRLRSDTIILQLTRQFEEQTKLLEDMRQSRASGLWARVKTAFGFAAS
jgi:hypothetical protein